MSISAVALFTDFGLKDNFTGVLKAVLLKINNKVKLLDVSHEIPSHDIEQAAFVLYISFSYFPKGTVFLAVVDPGVGSSRRPIAIKTQNYYFVGPDNGVLIPAAEKDGIEKTVLLENKKYFLKDISSVFHARDIFAPVAAHLSRGISINKFGTSIKSVKRIKFISPQISEKKIEARIMYIDKFGNLYTNITNTQFSYFLKRNKKFSAMLNKKRINKIYPYYAAAEDKEPFFINGSWGFLEIALKNKNAKDFFRISNKNARIFIRHR